MNILHLLGKRLSNGAKITTRNLLDLSSGGFATKKDWELLEKVRESNHKRSIKRSCNERDKYC